MKLHKTSHIPVRALILALPLFFSCVKEEGWDHAEGSRILFDAATYYENGAGTRTEYSGEMFTVDERRFERIDWVQNSDWIRILCNAASDGPAADYAITGDVSESEQVSSSASVTPLSHYGLHWGTGTHYFYAMYPAPGMKSNYQFKSGPGATPADRTVSASDATISVNPEDAQGAVITGYIPGSQEVVFVSSTASGKTYDEYKANMNYAYMYARNKVSSGSTGPVELAFKPLVTTFEFTLLAETGNEVDGDLVQVKLEASTALSGTFRAAVSESGNPAITPVGTTGSVITVAIPDENIRLSTTKPLKITLLSLPFLQTGLKLTLTFRKSDNSTLTRSLELKDGGTAIEVGACKKVYIQNVGVPESNYYLEPTGPTVVLGDSDGTEAQILRLVSGNAGTTGTAPFNSYRKVVGGDGTRIAVDNVEVFQYALANADGSPVLQNGHIAWQDATTLPTGLSAVLMGADGSVAKTASANIGAYPSSAVESVNEDDLRRERLVENTELYGEADDLDLAFYDFENRTMRTHPTTANCYIVDRAGTFVFPLVYGNAIDWTKNATVAPGWINGANVFAFHDGSLKADGNVRGNEFDAMHRLWASNSVNSATGMTTPFILDQISGLTLGNVEAVIVWQDVPSSTPIIKTSSVEVFSNTKSYIQNQFYKPGTGFKSSVPYIRFEIPKQSIRQGNAVIALRRTDVTEKPILWSWHIWITDGYDEDGDGKGDGFHPVTGVSAGSGSPVTSNALMRMNLGWCSDNEVSRKADRVWYVRVHQTVGRAEPLVFKVIQAPPVEVTEHHGSNTYYQWGRKDPFLPSDGVTNDGGRGHNGAGLNKAYHSPAAYSIVSTTSKVTTEEIAYNATYRAEAGHVYFTIQQPYVFHWCSHDPVKLLEDGTGFSDLTDIPTNYLPPVVRPDNNKQEVTGFGSQHNWFMGAYPSNLWNMNVGLNRNSDDEVIRGADLRVAKSAYDPCPPGYCVPNRSAFANLGSTTVQTETAGPYALQFTVGGETIVFPLSGWRAGGNYVDDTKDWLGEVHNVFREGACWTAGTFGEDDFPETGTVKNQWEQEIKQRSMSVLFLFNDGGDTNVRPYHPYYRSAAFPVRAAKEQ